MEPAATASEQHGAANVAEPVVAQQPVAEQPVVVEPQKKKTNYVPQNVKFEWKDFARFIDELSHESVLQKLDVQIEVLALGCTAIRKGEHTTGKVLRIDSEMPNIRPLAERRIRVIERLLAVCTQFLCQAQDGVEAIIYDLLGQIIVDIYNTDSVVLRSLRSYFRSVVLPGLRYLVDEVKAVGPHTRLSVCVVIDDIEESETKAVASLDTTLHRVIMDATQQESEQNSLFSKLAAIKGQESNSQCEPKSLHFGEVVGYLDLFDVLPMSILSGVLDVAIAAEVRQLPPSKLSQFLQLAHQASSTWQDAARVLVLTKLLELLRAMIFNVNELPIISLVLSELIPSKMFETLVAKFSAEDRSWLSASAAKIVEIMIFATEKELDYQLIELKIPEVMSLADGLSDNVDIDKVYRRGFDYVGYLVNAGDNVNLLNVGIPVVKNFMANGLPAEFGQDADLLAKTLELCSLFVRQKSDAKILASFFTHHMIPGFVIPNSWQSTSGNERNKKDMLLDIFTLGYLCVQNKITNRYKYFSWFMPPTYQLVDNIKLDEDHPAPVLEENGKKTVLDRIQVLREIIDVCMVAIRKGSDIDLLLRDGVPMIIQLYAETNIKDIVTMLRYIVKKFETNGSFFMLLELKFALDLAGKFEFASKSQVEELFRTLLQRGQREYIKSLIKVCSTEMNHERYRNTRSHLFLWIEKGLNLREFNDLCTILGTMFGLFRQNNETVSKLTTSILAQLEALLEKNEFTKESSSAIMDSLSRVVLYKNLFPTEFDHFKDLPAEELMQIFSNKFPPEVVQDAEAMRILSTLGERIGITDTNCVKYKHVTTFTLECLDKFFKLDLTSSADTNPGKMYQRRKYLDEVVYHLAKNQDIRSHLMQQGYHESVWQKDVSLKVEIEDKKNIEENFKAALLGLYSEYIDLVKTLHPSLETVNVDGKEVKLKELFEENHRISFSLEELRSRRNVALKLIERKVKDHPRKTFLQNRKLSLLAREDELEANLEQQKRQEKLEASQKRTYWIRFNTSFWRTADTIVGCYAPNGDHAEKPLENSLKANAAFISVYEENPDRRDFPGAEIENVEVLFTDQGLYVYKLYTNGHAFDTSLVWVQFFKTLIESNLVPCIIVPTQFPNSRVYNLLESFVTPQIAGSVISYKDDFFEEAGVDSYYDIKAEKIKQGDLLLDESSVAAIVLPDVNIKDGLRGSAGRTRLRTSTSVDQVEKQKVPQARKRPDLDLVGTLLTNLMKKLKKTMEDNQDLAPLLHIVEGSARFLSQYITLFIESGVRDPTLLAVGFDLDQWNRRKKLKSGQKMMSEVDREALVKAASSIFHDELDIMCSLESLRETYSKNRNLFFELQAHVEAVCYGAKKRSYIYIAFIDTKECLGLTYEIDAQETIKNKELVRAWFNLAELATRDLDFAKNTLARVRKIQRQFIHTTIISSVPRKSQDQLIKWMFCNEDRVWRDRGGRPGEETLQTFLNFVRPGEAVPQLLLAQPQQALPPPAAQDSVVAPQSEEPEFEEPKQALSVFRPDHYGRNPFGGFVTFASKKDVTEVDMTSNKANSDIIAYCIGDFTAVDNFEIVTAWVHPRYRNLGLAMELYASTMEVAQTQGVRYCTFDVLQGTIERMYEHSLFVGLLAKMGFLNWIFKMRKLSYDSEDATGKIEQFEKVVVDMRYLLFGHKLYLRWRDFRLWLQTKFSAKQIENE